MPYSWLVNNRIQIKRVGVVPTFFYLSCALQVFHFDELNISTCILKCFILKPIYKLKK